MTPAEIAARGREIGRSQWGKPLPPKAIELLRLYTEQANEEVAVRPAS